MPKPNLSKIKVKKENQLPSPGRKKKPENEVLSESITMKFTKSEMQTIKNKAGLAPLGRYIRHILTEQTDIFQS